MDLRPLALAAVLLVALIVAVVAMPVSLVARVLRPTRRPVYDDDDKI